MALVYVGLGANLDDPMANVLRGWQRLAVVGPISLEKISHPYRTSPVGMASCHWFVNAVGLIETVLSPEALHVRMAAIEQEFGRDRSRSRDRTLDLDILFYDALVMMSPYLTIPHPRIAERLFVLEPMAEIAPPGFRHPVLGKSVHEMLAALSDSEQRLERFGWPRKETA